MQSLSHSFQNFMKMALLHLATSTLDHRNYHREKGKLSPLVKSVQEHNNSLDKGISALCDWIASNPVVLEKVQNLRKMHEDEAEDGDGDEDEDEDAKYEGERDLFDQVIDFMGLFEINSLHADEVDNFRDKFIACLPFNA